MKYSKLTHKDVLEYFDFKDGYFYWKKIDFASNRKIGQRVGSINGKGYWYLSWKKCVIPCHRLVWMYYNKEWPSSEIDHIDGDRLNNKIENLRLSSRQENCTNFKIHRDGKTPYVSFCSYRKDLKTRPWIAKSSAFKSLGLKRRHIGYFPTKFEAIQAVNEYHDRIQRIVSERKDKVSSFNNRELAELYCLDIHYANKCNGVPDISHDIKLIEDLLNEKDKQWEQKKTHRR